MTISVLLCVLQALAQQGCKPFFRGTKTLYEPSSSQNIPAPPNGYEPDFINYVGRHGARHPTNSKELKRLKASLERADSTRQLTANGATLLEMTQHLWKAEAGYTMGDITQRGVDELAGIGRRMKTAYTMLTADNFKVCTTPQARTRQSAKAFINGLGFEYPLDSSRLNETDTVQLRFYDIAPAYLRFAKSENVRAEIDKMLEAPETKEVTADVAHRFFIKDYADKLLDDSKGAAAFMISLFGIAVIEKGMQHEIEAAGFSFKETDITTLFTCKELEWLEAVADAKDFLVKGPGLDANGIQIRIAAPLLLDFLQSTDNALTGEASTKAVLRFTHAEAIAPLSALMEIEGAASATENILRYEKVWQAGRMIPFSANIQWILFTKSGSEPLIEILMNEAPVHIPVVTSNFPYYSWNKVKAYYTKKLAAIGVQPGTDMYQWLQKVAVR